MSKLLRPTVSFEPAAAHNQGIAAAKGDWIPLLDAVDGYFADDVVLRVGCLADGAHCGCCLR